MKPNVGPLGRGIRIVLEIVLPSLLFLLNVARGKSPLLALGTSAPCPRGNHAVG